MENQDIQDQKELMAHKDLQETKVKMEIVDLKDQ